MAKFLIDTGRILPQAIDEIFLQEADENLSSVVTMLCQQQSVSPQYLNEAFVAMENDETMKVLLRTRQISSDAIDQVFTRVAKYGRRKMIELLPKQASPEAVTNAFLDAVKRGNCSVAKLLLAEQHASVLEMKELFKSAVATRKYAMVETLIYSPKYRKI